MKTRDEVVKSCYIVAVACWNYYSDSKLTDEQQDLLRSLMAKVLPTSIETKDWQKFADHSETRRTRASKNEEQK